MEATTRTSSRSPLGARQLWPVVLGALLFGAASWASGRVSAGAIARDQDAPEFEAPLVLNAEELGHDGTLRLSELRGRAVVLDFWASWCGPCRAEAPIMQRLYAQHAADGLTVVGVNTSDDSDAAAPAARSLGMKFPVVVDERNAIAKSYGVHSLPSLVVISRSGKIIAVRVGVTSESTLEELVRQALAS